MRARVLRRRRGLVRMRVALTVVVTFVFENSLQVRFISAGCEICQSCPT